MKKAIAITFLFLSPLFASTTYPIFNAGILTSSHQGAPFLVTAGFSMKKPINHHLFSLLCPFVEIGISTPQKFELDSIYNDHLELVLNTRVLMQSNIHQANNNTFFIATGIYTSFSKYWRYLPKWSFSEKLEIIEEDEKILDLEITKITVGPSISFGLKTPHFLDEKSFITIMLGYDQPLFGDTTRFNPFDYGRVYLSLGAKI